MEWFYIWDNVKGNKVLDFVLTIYIMHFFVCFLYNKFHSLNFAWYTFNAIWPLLLIIAKSIIFCVSFLRIKIVHLNLIFF